VGCWEVSWAAVSAVNGDSPVISQGGPWVANRYTLLTNTAAVFYRIKMIRMNLSRDQLYSHECLRELAFLSPSLENYDFCCFSKKQQQKNWLCLSLLLLSMSILPYTKWWMDIYIHSCIIDFKNKHLHFGKN